MEAQRNAQPHRKQQDSLLRITGESTRLKRKKLDEVYRLPRDADVAAATASQVDGLLTIRIPKRLSPAARRIPISLKAAGGRRKLPETRAEQNASSAPASSKGSFSISLRFLLGKTSSSHGTKRSTRRLRHRSCRFFLFLINANLC